MGKKEKIIEDAQALVVDGKLNLTILRREFKSFYMKIAAVFDNIEEFKEMMKPVECIYERYRMAPRNTYERYLPQINSKTLRNQLALDKLEELRSEKTFDQIADFYGVSRQAVHYLYDALLKAQQETVDVSTNQIYNQNTNL
jgi:predicted DNA-binding protein YlxM (UPF0122 family)